MGEIDVTGNRGVFEGTGTKISPIAPSITSANPLIELIINNLGYLIGVNKP